MHFGVDWLALCNGHAMRIQLLIPISIIIFFQLPSFGQTPSTPKIRELLFALKNSNPDTSRVNLLLALSNRYFVVAGSNVHKTDSALAFAGQAKTLSDQIHYEKGQANAALTFGKIYQRNGQKELGKAYVQKAISEFNDSQDNRNVAESYLILSDFYDPLNSHEIDLKIHYYETAARYFQLAGASQREADTYNGLGDFHSIQGKQVESITDLKKALQIYESLHTPGLQSTYDLLGTVSSEIGDFKAAIKYGLLALKTAELLKDTTLQLCTIYNRLGVTYSILKQYKEAYFYFQKSIVIANKYNDLNSIMTLTVNISGALLDLNEPQKALLFLKDIEKKYPLKELRYRAFLYSKMIATYTRLKQFPIAQKYVDQLLHFFNNIDKNDSSRDLVYASIIPFFIATKQYSTARSYLMAYQDHSRLGSSAIEMVYNNKWWFQLDSAQAKFPLSLKKYIRYFAFKDSLYNENKSKQIAEIEIQFQTEAKNQEIKSKEQHIELLNRQEKLQQSNIQQAKLTRNMILCGVILLLLLLGVSYNRYLLKRSANQRLEDKQLEINSKNESLQSLVDQKDALLEEKEWLMKEIHHRVKNNLQIVISLLSTQSAYVYDEKASAAIKESQHRMHSISLIHQKLYQMDSRALIQVKDYINDLIDYLRQSFDTGTKVIFEKEIVDLELDASRAVPLGLILNEAITNSLKYAFPGDNNGVINVKLCRKRDHLFNLVIADNGIGLPSTFDVEHCQSLGVNLMKELCKQIGSDLKIKKDKGVSVTLDFTDHHLINIS